MGGRWWGNGKLHRVDGPAYAHGFYWHGKAVKREDLPWLRRGHYGMIVPLAACTGTIANQQGGGNGAIPRAWRLVVALLPFTDGTTSQQHGGGSGGFPAWTRDARVTMTGAATQAAVTYRSTVGGVVLLCV